MFSATPDRLRLLAAGCVGFNRAVAIKKYAVLAQIGNESAQIVGQRFIANECA